MALTYPWFLLGMLSLAIPIAIHLFELRRPQRLLFTNVGFIKEVKLVTARQRKLKHLLILLSRLGFLFFLVLLFCQPFVAAPQQTAKSSGRVQVVVDASASMQAEGIEEKPLLDEAIEQAQALPTAYPTGTRYLLNQKQASLSADAFRSAVEALSVSNQEKAVNSVLASNATTGTKPEQLFVFSDFQKSKFSSSSLTMLDSSQQVFLVPLAGQQTRNVYVDSVWLDDAFVRPNTDFLLHIRLKNGGNKEVADCQAKLFIGNRQATAFRTMVPAGQAVTSTARVRLNTDVQEQCRVELDDAPVAFDNTYFFVLQASPRIQILDLRAQRTSATEQLYNNEPLFSYAASDPQRLNYGQVASAHLIVVQELPQIEGGLRDNLRRAVQNGSSLVVIPSASASSRNSYTKLFQALGVGSVQWQPITTGTPVLRDVQMPSLQNPFFRDVFVGQTRQPSMPKAAPLLRWSRSGNEILQLSDGDSYLAQFGSGRGKVYVFAAPFSNGYSDFTNNALFVPVMYRLAMQSYNNNDALPAYRLSQAVVSFTMPASIERSNAEQVVKLQKDSLTFIPAQRTVDGILRLEVPPGMQAPGFYSLRLNDKPISTLAFNVDKGESELASYSAAELRQLLGPNRPNVQVYDAANGQSVAARYRSERVGTPLWRYCLWLALACLLAEVLLLRFMGKRSVPVQPAAVAA